ncbi:MAG: DUF4178 domain-containing protein [Caulobacteraceae bacterium]
MLVAACPSCGAEIRFQSAAMPVKVCEYCHSAVVRTGQDLAAVGKVASLPDDVSPLKIGTRGMDGTLRFAVAGRIRWRWSAGMWTEWMALREDGSEVWLGEAMGRFMLMAELPAGTAPQGLTGQPTYGQQVALAGVTYTITDIKTAVCAGGQGELSYVPPMESKLLNIDLSADDGRCASIQNLDGETSYYAGRFATLEDLKPVGLRTVPGWDLPAFARV